MIETGGKRERVKKQGGGGGDRAQTKKGGKITAQFQKVRLNF